MDVAGLQKWLNEHGQNVVVDGQGGPATRSAIMVAFVNKQAPAVNPNDIIAFASELGCSVKQLNAIATVESAGGGFTNEGRPKILFERHYFWRLTQGRFGVQSYSNSKSGGYGENSWEKLCLAACKDPHAAFSSASWGKFQIMGAHWNALGYISPIAMAFTMTQSEGDHYEALVRFIKANGLQDEVRALSTNPADCVAFARKYNGPAYAKNRYDRKLADAMK